MKRTPLNRRSPLKRTGRIASKPRASRSAPEREASAAFHSATVSRGCEACPHRGETCDGPVQAHHVIPQQTLNRRGLSEYLWDKRNGMGLCERAHRRHTLRVQPIERALLRPEHLRFVADLRLDDVLDRYYH